MKKILTVSMLLIIVLSFLFSCNNGAPVVNDPNETNATNETTVKEEEPSTPLPEETPALPIIENRVCQYSIVRPEECSTFIISSMNYLHSAMVDKYICNITRTTDWVMGNPSSNVIESEAPEILIGYTNRPESREVHKTLTEYEYTYKVVGNKIVIIGYNDYLTDCAVKLFVDECLKKAGDDKFLLSDIGEGKGTTEGKTYGDSDATVRVMTFNVFGSNSNPDARIPHIINTIYTYDPTIIGFQECNKSMHDQMVAKLNGYSTALDKHPGTSTAVYTPIVYKTDMLELLDAGVEWLDLRYTKTDTKSVAYAVFKDRVSGEIFSVINVHVALWSSNNYELPAGKTDSQMTNEANSVWKPDNIRQMNDVMQRIIKEYGDIPVIWLGDFNFNETHVAYNNAVVKYGMKDAEKTATITADTGIKSHHSLGSVPASGYTIDHIFGNSKVIFRNHKICRTDRDLRASDHCPVYADLLFK